MIKIEYETENAAFEDNENEEARILKQAIGYLNQIEDVFKMPLYDINGNKVGYVQRT